uniref:cation:proton antiporter domain-containing protein n=1 Tax=Fulvivirga sp. TaxID=1931237 RepID=UPI00404AB5F9
VLLFQDIAVIPMLAILPLLVVGDATIAAGHGGDSFFDHLPAWQQTIAVLSSVVFIVIAGRVLIVPALRIVSKTHLRELFTASALLIVIAISYLMQTVGLSPALGAFLGGVVLANSEFRHELESDLEPFKGLLLGLFFIAVGASINFHLIADQPGLIALLVMVVMAVKTLSMLGSGKFFKLDIDQNLLFGLGLAQIGEFAFVLLSFASQLGLLDTQISGLIMAATAISMTISPILNIVNERVLLPRVGVKEKETKEMDAISESNGIILIGFSHFGSTVMRFLKIHGVKATILDNDSDRVALLRKMGFKVYYGDGTRVDLLESAGANTAKLLISAIDSPETNQRLVENVKKHFPNLELYVRAKNRYDAYELLDMGVNHIYRESLESSVRVGVDILTKLGFRAYSVNRSAQNFIKSDEASMLKLAKDRHNTEQYIVNVKNEIREQEMLLSEDAKNILASSDHAWDSELMRSTLNQISK